MKKFFNFNNEADLTEVDVNEETGMVTFSLGGQSQTFESMQEFAEFYAVARNVVPENLKNWTLIEDGTQVAFVLRAGTAGLNEQEIAGIARGLKAAGLGPDEIGLAMASMMANDGTANEQAVVSNQPLNLFNRENPLREVVENALADLSDVDLMMLEAKFGDDVASKLLESHVTQQRIKQYEYDLDDEYDEYTTAELVEYIIEDILCDMRSQLVDKYGDVKLGIDVLTRNIHTEESVIVDYTKANYAAVAASRKVEIKKLVINNAGDVVSEGYEMVDLTTILYNGYLYGNGAKQKFVHVLIQGDVTNW